MKAVILCGVFFVGLVGFAIASSSVSATTKPFVRSRYSKRWRIMQTTESNGSNNTLTTETQQAVVAGGSVPETTTTSNVASVGDTTTVVKPTMLPSTMSIVSKSTHKPKEGAQSTTTEHPKHPGSNALPLDYDYYGNGGENEDEAAHK